MIRTPRPSSLSPRRLLTAAALVVAVPLTGCGGDEASSTSGESPARLAPASTLFYAEAVIRPEGDQKADVLAFLKGAAPGQDPIKQLETFLDEDDGEGELVYSKDVKPWLGERAGLAITGLQANNTDPEVVGIVDTTDAKAATAALRKSGGTQVEEREHAGTTYLYLAGESIAGAVIDDELVVGTEGAFKAVVDAKDGETLVEVPAFEQTRGAVSDDGLLFLYGDVNKGFDLATKTVPADQASQLEQTRELIAKRGISTVGAALEVSEKVARFDVAAKIKPTEGEDAGAATVAGLPAGSWAALGLGDIGKSLTEGLNGLKGVTAPGFDVQGGLDQLEQQAGIDVQKDLLDWMGQSGLFVRGTSLTDIGGALVVQSKDKGKTQAALGKARTIVAGGGLPAADLTGPGIDDGFSVKLPNAPVEIFAALAGDRFVLAAGRPALDEAIKPSRKLEDEQVYKGAVEALGDDIKPTFLLDFPKVNGLIALAAGGQPGFAQAKPYLDALGTIAAGSKRDGDTYRSAFTVSLR